MDDSAPKLYMMYESLWHHTGWINIYEGGKTSDIFYSENQARDRRRVGILATVPVKWEVEHD